MKTVKQSVSTKSHESGKPKSASASGDSPLVLAQTLLAAGETDRAMSVLKDGGSTDAITNARGVGYADLGITDVMRSSGLCGAGRCLWPQKPVFRGFVLVP